ncbi:hypothetical protein [Mesobacillus selenatarsenatis]|uniref:hypothetical protein n=1 Tax=Mesobacillus selenatarsenatis TaxID=388741 RepID=UPI0005AB0EA6|nr:hypothetical protein [Mesobacillus selenatarsenatis]
MLKKRIVRERKSTATFNRVFSLKKYSSEAHSTRAKMNVQLLSPFQALAVAGILYFAVNYAESGFTLKIFFQHTVNPIAGSTGFNSQRKGDCELIIEYIPS